MSNIDTICEALERLKGFTYHAAGSQDSDDIKTLIAALSTIDPDAIRREVCDKIYRAVDAMPYAGQKREGKCAYDDALDEALAVIGNTRSAIINNEPTLEEKDQVCVKCQYHTRNSGDRDIICERGDFCHDHDGFLLAQDDGKPKVGSGDIVAYVFDDGEYTVEQNFSDDEINKWSHRPCEPVVIMRGNELLRRIDEATMLRAGPVFNRIVLSTQAIPDTKTVMGFVSETTEPALGDVKTKDGA